MEFKKRDIVFLSLFPALFLVFFTIMFHAHFYLFLLFAVPALIFLSGLLLTGLVFSKDREKPYLIFFCVFSIISIVVSPVISLVWGMLDTTEKMVAGNAEIIIKELERYREKYGEYPQKLDYLYPEFVDNKKFFNRIGYSTTGSTYRLKLFDRSSRCYESNYGEWKREVF